MKSSRHTSPSPYALLFPLAALLFPLAVILFASCASLPKSSLIVEQEWIEGKDMSIGISIQPGKKLDALREIGIAYTLASGQEMHRLLEDAADYSPSGVRYTVTIPGTELGAGELSFKISALRAKKSVLLRKGKMRILSRAEARRKRQESLLSRIDFSYESEVPFYRDSQFALNVRIPKADGRLVLFYRRPGDKTFITDMPSGEKGRYQIVFSKERLDQGYTEFYLSYTERDPDLDNISVYISPDNDDLRPYSLRVLSQSEVLAVIEAEMMKSLSHSKSPVSSILYDQDISASFKPEGTRFLSELLKTEAGLKLFCGDAKGQWNEYPLLSRGSSHEGQLSTADLIQGKDRYYFELSADLDIFGQLSLLLPKGGRQAPNILRVLDESGTRQRLISELKEALDLEIPGKIKETEAFLAQASIKPQAGGLYFRKAAYEDIQLKLRIQGPGYLPSRAMVMKRSGANYSFSLGPGQLRPGEQRYAIEVSAASNTSLGTIEFSLPGSNPASWPLVRVLSIEELREEAKLALLGRMSHPSPKTADGQSPLELKLSLRSADIATTCTLFYRRPGERIYQSRPMDKWLDDFSASISPAEQTRGYSRYYFVVSERDSELGLIEQSYPRDGELNPLEYRIKLPASKGDAVMSPVDTGKK